MRMSYGRVKDTIEGRNEVKEEDRVESIMKNMIEHKV